MGDLGIHHLSSVHDHTDLGSHREHRSREGHAEWEAQLPGTFSQLLSCRPEGFQNKVLRVSGGVVPAL